jgi:hypothetical protein
VYRSPDNGVTWVSFFTSSSSEIVLFGDKIYSFDLSTVSVGVRNTNTWAADANETLPNTYASNTIRKSKNGNVLVYRGTNSQWYKKIGTGSWTVCPYLTDQISSGAEFVAIGESDFIFFDNFTVFHFFVLETIAA